jgi:hypothetical protein|tara:strand:+ start:1563 stop:1844 length:282 start_codon:yes stop_codon:yes gene_type:complete
MKTTKKIKLTTECGREFTVDLHEVAENRSVYYAEKDSETSYDSEYDFIVSDENYAIDWMQNNMDWYEMDSLKEISVDPPMLSDLEINDMEIVK